MRRLFFTMLSAIVCFFLALIVFMAVYVAGAVIAGGRLPMFFALIALTVSAGIFIACLLDLCIRLGC